MNVAECKSVNACNSLGVMHNVWALPGASPSVKLGKCERQ